MGKSICLAIVLMLAVIPFASADATIDPMVWSKAQWRSDLHKTHHVNAHRQNLRFPKRVVTRIVVEKEIVRQAPSARGSEAAPIARPKFIVIGASEETLVSVQSAPGSQRSCRGMLVLTWNGHKAVPRCHRSETKPRAMSPGEGMK